MSHTASTSRELLHLMALFKSIKLKHSHSLDGAVVIQNVRNGPPCVTRHSLRLIQQYTTNNPLVRLLMSAVQSHLDLYKDGGCMLGMLICTLVTKFYGSGYHPKLYSQVIHWSSQQCSTLLPHLCSQKLEMGVESISSALYGILYSKLSLFLCELQLHTLVNQLTELFVYTEGCLATNSLAYLRGTDTQLSTTLYKGVVLDIHHSPTTLPPGLYTCVLVSSSMSGDSESLDNVTLVGTTSQLIPQVVIERMEEIVKMFANEGVTLCLCQRVIHPRLKLLLESHGVRYLERLGLTINRLSHLTGLSPIQCITDNRTATVKTSQMLVTHIRHNSEMHLLLSCQGVDCKPTFALQLCHWTEQITKELEVSCEQALAVLQVLLSDTRLLPGEGVWQTAVAAKLTEQALKVSAEEANKYGANVSSFRGIVKDFTDSLLAAAGSFDMTTYRRHTSERDIDMQDCYVAQTSAVSTSVAIASAIIQTNNVVVEL